MVLHVKSVLFVAVLFTILNIVLCLESDEDSSEEDPIRQALALIHLIRRAGAALQENSLFSNHAPLPKPGSPIAPRAPLQLSSFNNASATPSNQILRRRMPEGFFRRKADDDLQLTNATKSPTSNDANTKATKDTSTTNPVPSARTAAKGLLKARVRAAYNNKTRGTRKKADRSKNKNHSLRKPAGSGNNQKQLQLKSPIVEKLNKSTGNSTEGQDPIISQVAIELEHEMDQMSGQDRSDAASAYHKYSKDKLIARLRPNTKPHTTLRVHLGGSTRYPIPFPVNHALCFTDPHNGLCRTPL